jgi:hypothetical protein
MSGYIVTRPYPASNVGSNLSSLAGAAYVARTLERELVVDWRGMRQLRDPELNYFSEFFARPPLLETVPVHYAPFEDGDYSESSPEAEWLEPGYAYLAAADRATDLRRFVVLRSYHGPDRVHPGPESERLRLLERVYRDIAPVPRIVSAIDAWWHENVRAGFVVAVNVRTGNGQYFRKGDQYGARVDISLFENENRFLRLLERACRSRLARLPRYLREDFQIFYATDSAQMSAMLGRLPNAITRRKTFPPRDSGDLYAFGDGDYSDRDAVDDTLADMFMLARCDAMVYNTSLFNQYARVTTAYFGGNHVHFESLVLRKRLRYLAGSARRRLLSPTRPLELSAGHADDLRSS